MTSNVDCVLQPVVGFGEPLVHTLSFDVTMLLLASYDDLQPTDQQPSTDVLMHDDDDVVSYCWHLR